MVGSEKGAPPQVVGSKAAEEVAKRVVDDIFDAMWSRKEELLTLRRSEVEEGEGGLRIAVEHDDEPNEETEEERMEQHRKAVAFTEALSAIPASALIPIALGGRGALAMSVMPGCGLSPGFGSTGGEPSKKSILAHSADVVHFRMREMEVSPDELGAGSEPIPEEVFLANPEETGLQVWADVFRRADKNDDGKISYREFCQYFSDKSLSDSDRIALFGQIDTHGTMNISRKELCDYFSTGYGPYAGLYTSLAKMHQQITDALNHSSRVYPNQGFFDKYKTRFYLKEVERQLQSLYEVCQTACQRLNSFTSPEVSEQTPSASPSSSSSSSSSSSLPINTEVRDEDLRPTLAELQEEVARLASVVNRLTDVRIEVIIPRPDFEQTNVDDVALVSVVSRELKPIPFHYNTFRDSLRQYVSRTRDAPGCRGVTVKSLATQNSFLVYEIWSEEHFMHAHFSTIDSKIFQRAKVDYLEEGEKMKCMSLPSSWGWHTTDSL